MCCIKSSWWSCFQIVQCSRGKKEGICEGRCLRVVNPPCPQILRIDREGTIDKVIMHSAYDVICHLFKLYNLTWLAYYPPITLLLILQWHTRVCEETFNVNSKITQTMQNIRNFIVRKSIYKKWKISDSHLETGRKSSKSGVSWIIWERGQHRDVCCVVLASLRSVCISTPVCSPHPAFCIFELFFWEKTSRD